MVLWGLSRSLMRGEKVEDFVALDKRSDLHDRNNKDSSNSFGCIMAC